MGVAVLWLLNSGLQFNLNWDFQEFEILGQPLQISFVTSMSHLFGILLFQDLAVVPLLVVTPLLAGTGAQLGAALRLAAVKSASALLLIFLAGRLLLQRIYKLVAAAKDQTSFLAITLGTVLSMAGFTAALGLSDTLGAFLAGVLLAETKYRYQIEADIAPFRGLLLGLFFITTGATLICPPPPEATELLCISRQQVSPSTLVLPSRLGSSLWAQLSGCILSRPSSSLLLASPQI